MAPTNLNVKNRWLPRGLYVSSLAVLAGAIASAYVRGEDPAGASTKTYPITDLPSGLHILRPEKHRKFYSRKRGMGFVIIPKSVPGSPAPPHWGKEALAATGFLGPKVCEECHPDRYEEYARTAHARTAFEPSASTILGKFDAEHNRLETRDANLNFQMEAAEDGFYENVFVKRDGKLYTHRRRIDLVIGSGNHGQSYLHWDGDRLYQLPVSYYR